MVRCLPVPLSGSVALAHLSVAQDQGHRTERQGPWLNTWPPELDCMDLIFGSTT